MKTRYSVQRHWLDEEGEAHHKVVAHAPDEATALRWLEASSPRSDEGEVMRCYTETRNHYGAWEQQDGFWEYDGQEVWDYHEEGALDA